MSTTPPGMASGANFTVVAAARRVGFGYPAVMDSSETSGAVERRYLEAQARLSAFARVERAAEMFAWSRGFIGRQIRAERGEMSPERLKWEVALRLYGGDDAARALIQRKLDRVSG